MLSNATNHNPFIARNSVIHDFWGTDGVTGPGYGGHERLQDGRTGPCGTLPLHQRGRQLRFQPICYPCWLSFDRFEIHECDECHWFLHWDLMFDTAEHNHPLRDKYETLCYDCAHGREVPVYTHGPVERQTRYLYILKLVGGK